MKLVIGLGNPGKEYSRSRHNVGHLFIDEAEKNIGRTVKNVKFIKTDTFMNESGDFVSKMLAKHRVELNNLFVIHDDLDIPLGSYKIQMGRGPKDHNGLNDIYEKLGSKDFWHVRVGVDNRPSDNRPMGVEYVLQDFDDSERNTLEVVTKQAWHELSNLLK